MNIFGIRFSLIGDMIMALPIKDYLARQYPGSKLCWSIAKKCQQAEPLFQWQPGIETIKISDHDEELGPEDRRIMEASDLVFNVKPPHPAEQDWYNYRSCVEETALQAGLDPQLVKGRMPILYQAWKRMGGAKSVAIYPFAGYGRGLERSPTPDWWREVVRQLLDLGYLIYHFGTDNEPDLSKHAKYIRMTHATFALQVRMALDCAVAIGTDSGSMWCLAAYGLIPQVNLITNWLPNHKQNHLALAPVGPLVTNLFAEGGCSNIPTAGVIATIEKLYNND